MSEENKVNELLEDYYNGDIEKEDLKSELSKTNNHYLIDFIMDV